jgi:uncharacterized membrane protein
LVSRIFEVLGLAVVAAAWLLAAQVVPTLPARIPTHFGVSGAADAYGPHSSLWLMPAVITGMYVFLGAAQLIPPRFMNVPIALTVQNRTAVYALAREMLSVLKFGTLLTLLAVEWGVIDAALRGAIGWYFTLVLSVTVGTCIGIGAYYIMRMRSA